LETQQSKSGGALWLPPTPVALATLSNGLREMTQNWLHLFSFPGSDCMDVLLHSNRHAVPHRHLGTPPQRNIAVPL